MLRSLLGAVLLLTLIQSSHLDLAAADDPKKVEVKVAGLLFDKKDDWITVKADGEDDPVKYFIAKDADKKWSRV